jgi:hypothetical protein
MKTFFKLRAVPAPLKTNQLSVSSSLRLAVFGSVVLFGMGIAGSVQAQAVAQQELPVQVTQPEAAALRVRVSSPDKKPIHLEVVHLDNGNWMLNETHRTAVYSTLLKFDGVPSGSYAVVLRVGPNRYRYTVRVDTKAASATTIAVRETTTHRVESGLATAALYAGAEGGWLRYKT